MPRSLLQAAPGDARAAGGRSARRSHGTATSSSPTNTTSRDGQPQARSCTAADSAACGALPDGACGPLITLLLSLTQTISRSVAVEGRARTRRVSALLCAVALLATGPPAHARTHAAKSCVKPVGAATVHRDRYTVRYRKIIGSAPDLRVFYWACLRATGKCTRLTEATGKNDMAPILNSRF
jgi:hypothetical protein